MTGAVSAAPKDPGFDAAFQAAFHATWPPAEQARAGGFRIGRAPGAGRRVNAAWRHGDWTEADIDNAAAIQRRWEEPPLFAVHDGDAALAAAFGRRGWARRDPTVLMQAPVGSPGDRPIPPVTALTLWPPLAIQRDIWNSQGIGPARQAVMGRASQPRTTILGRIRDRAGGTALVAAHGPIAMLHALVVVPELRRLGLAGWMVRRAALWAAEQGCERLGLAVERANAEAVALYEGLGFTLCGGYAYWSPA